MMSLEDRLIEKSYYKTFLNEDDTSHPIQVLGELYMNEQQNEVPNLSYIRYAQGEVYFLNKDYEAAIFKWENVSNELKAWAQKNIADAHYELDLLAIAEDHYKAIKTDSDILKMEVLLQLFSLYIERENNELASETIKKAVKLNPDYPHVTELAKTFFENQQSDVDAVELAVKEAIRTKSLSWFATLEKYVEKGLTKNWEPNYFSEALVTLYPIDKAHFESLIVKLWESYQSTKNYFDWLREINHILLGLDTEETYTWRKLSQLYQETFARLTDGSFLIKEISHLIPNHLTNWLKVATTNDSIIAASAVLAWSEFRPSDLDEEVTQRAENEVKQSSAKVQKMEEVYPLFESIQHWTNEKGIELSERFQWAIQQLMDTTKHRLLVFGEEGIGKSSVLESLVGKEPFGKITPSAVLYQHAEEKAIQQITDEEQKNIDNFEELEEVEASIIELHQPISFLKDNNVSVLDVSLERRTRKNRFSYTQLADSVLVVFHLDQALSNRDLETAIKLNEQEPNLPVHFVIHHTGTEASELENATAMIRTYFPNASIYTNEGEFTRFITSIVRGPIVEENRTAKMLYYMKESIQFLFQKHEDTEQALVEKISWNEEMLTKMKGAVNQVQDMEEEKGRSLQDAFTIRKNKLRKTLKNKLPVLLQGASLLVKDNSDLGKIHKEINDEMNRRINDYLENTALPDFRKELLDWIEECETELRESQMYLNDMSQSFNEEYEKEKLALQCDARVLEDWRRDIDRMTIGSIQREPVHFLSRFAPSSFLLKGAGKIFDAIPQKKGMLQNKYKEYIKDRNYDEQVEKIVTEFLDQFKLFERSLQRDVQLYFASPLEILKQTVEEIEQEISHSKAELEAMQQNPEIYNDPLILFELKTRQLEQMGQRDRYLVPERPLS